MPDYGQVYEKLGEISPSFCMAKWQMLTLYLNNGNGHSCFLPFHHKISRSAVKQNPSALHNTPQKKQARKEMLEGKRPEECNYCWKMEDMGQISDRAIRSEKACNLADRETIATTPWDSDNVKPLNLEVSFSSTCNLKCSYCSPGSSTTWYEEIVEHGGYPTSTNFNGHVDGSRVPYIRERDANPYVDAFWEWLPDIIAGLKVLRVTGGEPLMTPHTFKLMRSVSQQHYPGLQFSVNSNLSIPDVLFEKYLSHVQMLSGQVMAQKLYVSLDGVGAQAEYQRFGLDYERLLCNVHRVLRETSVSVSFMVTFNILCLGSFKEFLRLILDLRAEYGYRVSFDTPVLRYPRHQNISLLPASYVTYFDDFVAFMHRSSADNVKGGFLDLDIKRMERARALMLTDFSPQERDVLLRDFYIFFKEHDRRRGTDFPATFPELMDLYRQGEVLDQTAWASGLKSG
jgi:organic radical activating enzyme